MGIYAIRRVYGIRCDECGDGEDTLGEYRSAQEMAKDYRHDGWTGDYKKIYCPKCSARRKAEKKGGKNG